MKYRTPPPAPASLDLIEADVRTALRTLGDRVLAERRPLTAGEWDRFRMLRDEFTRLRQERRRKRQRAEARRAA